MSNPEFGFDEMIAAQNQPEVVINAADRAITKAIAGEAVVDFESDADYTLEDEEWSRKIIRVTDSGNVLTTGRSVVFPDIAPLAARPVFVFVNETAQTLTIMGDATSATGVEVQPGESSLVRYNGTDVEQVAAAGGGGGGGGGSAPVVVQLACSDLTTALQEGTVAYFRAAQAFTLTDLSASLLIESDQGDVEIDVKKNGLSILGVNLLLIEEGQKSSLDSSPQPDIDEDAIALDDEITVHIVDVATGSAARGLIVTLKGAAQ